MDAFLYYQRLPLNEKRIQDGCAFLSHVDCNVEPQPTIAIKNTDYVPIDNIKYTAIKFYR